MECVDDALGAAKRANELGYLRSLLACHAGDLDERLYYLCKTYTTHHRIEMKRRKGELRKSKRARRSGTCEECVSIGEGRILLVGDQLPVMSPVLLNHPMEPGVQIHVTFRTAGGAFARRQLWVNIIDSDDYVEVGRWRGIGWEEHSFEGDTNTTLRDKAMCFFEQPFSSTPAKLYFFFQVMLILLSITALCMETVPRFNPDLAPEYKPLWTSIELAVTVVFTLEAVLRIALQRNRIAFIKKPTVIADVLAVLPFYFEEVFSAEGKRGPDVLKLCRLFRLMKFFRNFRPIENLVRAIEKSAEALIAPFVFLTACSLVTSAAMYFCEKGEYDSEMMAFMVEDPSCTSIPARAINESYSCVRVESKFTSIPHTFWWSIVTMTTVGYGDMVPVSSFGKLVGSLSMILGIMFMAMPIAIVGSYFTVVVDVHQEVKTLEKTGGAAPVAGGNRMLKPVLHSTVNSMASLPVGRQPKSPTTPSGFGTLTLPPATRAMRDPKKEAKELLESTLRPMPFDMTPPSNINADTLTKGERLSVFLKQVMPEMEGVWSSAGFVHHSDVWLDSSHIMNDELSSTLSADANTRNRNRANSMGAPAFGSLELAPAKPGRGAPPGGDPPAAQGLVWLMHNMSFTIGSSCKFLPDPDIVLGDEGCMVSHRHAEVVVQRWWTATSTVRIRPVAPSRLTVNGSAVPRTGVVLSNNDSITFGDRGPTYVFRTDRCSDAIGISQTQSSGKLNRKVSSLREGMREGGAPQPRLAGSARRERSKGADDSWTGRAEKPGKGASDALHSSPAEQSSALLSTPLLPNPLRQSSVQSWVRQLSQPAEAVSGAGNGFEPVSILLGSVDSDEENLGAISSPVLPRGAERDPRSRLESSLATIGPPTPLSSQSKSGVVGAPSSFRTAAHLPML